ncbi:hypothetical protein CC79DRAFT_1373985 [Sarocladium strictum]
MPPSIALRDPWLPIDNLPLKYEEEAKRIDHSILSSLPHVSVEQLRSTRQAQRENIYAKLFNGGILSVSLAFSQWQTNRNLCRHMEVPLPETPRPSVLEQPSDRAYSTYRLMGGEQSRGNQALRNTAKPNIVFGPLLPSATFQLASAGDNPPASNGSDICKGCQDSAFADLLGTVQKISEMLPK